MSRKRVIISALLLALVLAVVAVPGIPLASGTTERLSNGSFEEGFHSTPASFVGDGWHWFHNGGQATYAFDDETWAPVIHDANHGQLIEINTYDQGASDADRFAGIYQTVAVVPGERYELSLHGMLRALEEDPDLCCYNYRVQYGVDLSGGTDWTAVDEWFEIPWDTVYPLLSPGTMDTYSATIQATGPRLTLFIRLWKKTATVNREVDLNLDAISLKGAIPPDVAKPSVHLTAPVYPVVGWDTVVPVVSSSDVGVSRLEFYDGDTLVDTVSYAVGMLNLAHDFGWRPGSTGGHTLRVVAYDVGGEKAIDEVAVTVGQEGQFVANGDFEGGFRVCPRGLVGMGWGCFDNDGDARFGFYDETWTPVIHDGAHGQLIEIDTVGQSGSDPDRYAGIYQTVSGLTPGATYRLALYGMLRVLSDADDDEGYGYRVQWGYDPAGGTDWTAVENWVELPWDTAYPPLEPGEMSSYSTSFEAPSPEMTLFIRAWKKWGTAGRDLNVNLDTITLKGYK